MKINYLILVHNNFDHLNLLINSLDDMDISFFIHVDKKSFSNYISSKSNVYVLKNRVIVNWGGFGMVEATLKLMKFATEQINEGYYCLISGSDYPIKSNEYIKHVLVGKTEYINILSAPLPHKPMSRFNYYYFNYNRRKMNWVNSKLAKLEITLIKLNVKRSIPFTIFVGSQWMVLTNECVRYIIKTSKSKLKYKRFFRFSFIPDEAFFHTIIGNSEFLKNVKPNLTYTDWSIFPGPAMITKKHIELFKYQYDFKSDYGISIPLFARKFSDENIDVVRQIERELRIK